MIKSMTGFGKSVVELENRTISIEVRSVNSKNFDFYTRIPSHFREKEAEIRKLAQHILSRGKIELSMNEAKGQAVSLVNINPAAMKKHYKAIQSVAEDLGLNTNSDILGAIMKIPDVLLPEENELDPQEWDEISKGVEKALKALNDFRIDEGAALEVDFTARIAHIRAYQQEIRPFEEARIEHLKTKFKKDISAVIDRSMIDENRFEQEIMYYIEKLDVTEEQIRLSQHLDYFTEVLHNEGAQGKKLNFIGQEIGRELNTLGSKANHAEIQKIIVNMKDELEKIKEQMLNIL